MIRVKVLTSLHTEYNHFIKLFPKNQPYWENFYFDFNDKLNFIEYDFLVIIDNYDKKVFLPKNCKGSLLILMEPSNIKKYRSKPLSQFNYVISSQTKLSTKNIVLSQLGYPWLNLKTFKDFELNNRYKKTKDLCIILSNKTHTIGHKKRYEFYLKLKLLFGEKLDSYGRGINHFSDKSEILKQYKYSIAIENSDLPFNITEKITDCFCTLTFPFYFGPKNIDMYYPAESFRHIDIDDVESAYNSIKLILDDKDHYKNNLKYLLTSKSIYLNKLQLIPLIVSKLRELSFNKLEKFKIKPNLIILDRIYNLINKFSR